MGARQRRHRGQAGTTLVELVVSVAIIGLAVVILVGAFSTVLINVFNQRQTNVAQAAIEFEMQKIQAAPYASQPPGYSECFGSDGSVTSSCGTSSMVQASASEQDMQPGVQQWTVTITTYPGGKQIGTPVAFYKIDR